MAEMSGLMMVLAVVVGVLWIALPFAVFGIKGRLDQIIKQLEKLNEANNRT